MKPSRRAAGASGRQHYIETLERHYAMVRDIANGETVRQAAERHRLPAAWRSFVRMACPRTNVPSLREFRDRRDLWLPAIETFVTRERAHYRRGAVPSFFAAEQRTGNDPKQAKPHRYQLGSLLKLLYGLRLADLPKGLQERVKEAFLPWFPWDALDERQRKCVVDLYDTSRVENGETEKAFVAGFQWVRQPNKRNAKRPRLRSRMVSDTELLAVRRDLEAEGIAPHKQVSKAHQRIGVGRLTLRGLRKRWARIGPKKGT